MPPIDPAMMCHRLCVNSKHKPVVQKRMAFNPEWYEAVNEKVKKFLVAGFIREVSYSKWCANMVLVKKANGKWRVCIRLHGSEQNLPKRLLLPSPNRTTCQCNGRTRAVQLHECVIRVQLDSYEQS